MTRRPEISAPQLLAAHKLIARTPVRVCRDLEITQLTLEKSEGRRKAATSRYIASKLRAYYEAAGVEFTSEPGVKMRAKDHGDTIANGDVTSDNNT